MVGFGAALTSASAFVIHQTPASLQQALFERLFGPRSSGGIALNFLRLPMGASDFSLAYGLGNITYDDFAGDESLAHFSTSADDVFFLPTLRQILDVNPHILTIASPWTAPLWMKTEQSNGGGTLRDTEDTYRMYAHYLAKYVLDYASKGIHIDYLTLQNEPGHGSCGPMPCMLLDPFQANRLALWFEWHRRQLGIKRTRLLAYDHNWDAAFWDRWSDVASETAFLIRWIAPLPALLILIGLSMGIFYTSRREASQAAPTSKASLRPAPKTAPERSMSCPGLCAQCDLGKFDADSRAQSISVPLLPAAAAAKASAKSPSMKGECCSAPAFAWESRCSGALLKHRCGQVTSDWVIYRLTAVGVVLRLVGLVLQRVTDALGTFSSHMGPSYPIDLLNMPGGFVIAGVAWHCYGGSPSAMGRVADKFASWSPPLEQHMTECSGGDWTGTWQQTLLEDQRVLFIGGAHNSGQSVLRWNLALDQWNGPHCLGGTCCRHCRGVVTVPSDATVIENVTFNVEFYGLAHHSAFVERGAHRVYSAVSGPAADVVHAVAYRNPAGDMVLVVLNDQDDGNVTVSVEDNSYNYTFSFVLPPGLATFYWHV